jgi:hypothetical protein
MPIDNNPTVCNVRNVLHLIESGEGSTVKEEKTNNAKTYNIENICATITYGFIGTNIDRNLALNRLNIATSSINLISTTASGLFNLVDHNIGEATKKSTGYVAAKTVVNLLPFIPSIMGLHVARTQLDDATALSKLYQECRYMYHDPSAHIFACNGKVPGQIKKNLRCFIPSDITDVKKPYIATNYSHDFNPKANALPYVNKESTQTNYMVGSLMLEKSQGLSYYHMRTMASKLHEIMYRLKKSYIDSNIDNLISEMCLLQQPPVTRNTSLKCTLDLTSIKELLNKSTNEQFILPVACNNTDNISENCIINARRNLIKMKGFYTTESSNLPQNLSVFYGVSLSINNQKRLDCSITIHNQNNLNTPIKHKMCFEVTKVGANNENYGYPETPDVCSSTHINSTNVTQITLNGEGCINYPIFGERGLLNEIIQQLAEKENGGYLLPYALAGSITETCEQSFLP